MQCCIFNWHWRSSHGLETCTTYMACACAAGSPRPWRPLLPQRVDSVSFAPIISVRIRAPHSLWFCCLPSLWFCRLPWLKALAEFAEGVVIIKYVQSMFNQSTCMHDKISRGKASQASSLGSGHCCCELRMHPTMQGVRAERRAR